MPDVKFAIAVAQMDCTVGEIEPNLNKIRRLAQTASEVLAWAHATRHPLAGETWLNEYDLVCALARDYLMERPDAVEAKEGAEAESGILSRSELDDSRFSMPAPEPAKEDAK